MVPHSPETPSTSESACPRPDVLARVEAAMLRRHARRRFARRVGWSLVLLLAALVGGLTADRDPPGRSRKLAGPDPRPVESETNPARPRFDRLDDASLTAWLAEAGLQGSVAEIDGETVFVQVPPRTRRGD